MQLIISKLSIAVSTCNDWGSYIFLHKMALINIGPILLQSNYLQILFSDHLEEGKSM